MKLKATKLLFGISLVLSCCSFIFKTKGYGEFYPFFYWKLYTQPMGSKYTVTGFRIYGVKNKDTVRIPNIGYKYLNQDDYNYFLRKEATRIKKKEKPVSYFKKRLFDFGQLIAPEYNSYLLVEETYNPLEIIVDSSRFKRNIIFKTNP